MSRRARSAAHTYYGAQSMANASASGACHHNVLLSTSISGRKYVKFYDYPNLKHARSMELSNGVKINLMSFDIWVPNKKNVKLHKKV